MRLIFGLVLMAGLGLAGFAVYLAQGYINGYQQELERARAEGGASIPTVDVYVVNRQMAYGEPLNPNDIRLVPFPVQAVPQGAFTRENPVYGENDNQPRVVIRALEADEALLQVKVTEPGQAAGITSRLKKGMRAFALRVDVASGVSGFLRPGDRVDVYWTGRAANGDVTKLIETGVELVAIDQIADEDLTGSTIARTVTVQATPQQVASLAQAQSTGRLSLSLLGIQDDSVADAIEVNQNSLLGIVQQQQAVAPTEEVCTIRTRRGAEVVEIPIPCAN